MSDIKPLLFITGNSRSGTTMLSRIIGKHSHFFSFRELHFFEMLYSPDGNQRALTEREATDLVARLLDIQRRGILSARQTEDFADEARQLVAGMQCGTFFPTQIFMQFLCYETRRNQRCSACEQTPKNVFYIDEILGLSEDALVIDIVRDPRDVLLSQKNRWRRFQLSDKGIPLKAALRNWINYSPFLTARIWRSSVRAGDLYARDDRVMVARFEDILENPQTTICNICKFLGVEFEAEMLTIENRGSSNRRDNTESVGIDRSKAGQWRRGGLNSTEIDICQNIAAQEMRRHGYEPVQTKPNYFLLLLYAMYLPLQLAVVFVINYRRFNRVVAAVKRRMAN